MTLAEKLGYEKHAKLLIIHADDGGFLQAANKATQRLLENGSITSASYMMPTPWIYQAARSRAGCPGCDAGVHIVLNSEWPDYRWGSVAPTNKVSSLLDEFGNLWSSHELYHERAQAEEVIDEIRAQIVKAFKLGFEPSHIDTHMGSIYIKPEVLEAYVKLAREFKLIPMLPKWSEALDDYWRHISWLNGPALKKLLLAFEKEHEVMLDRLILDAGGSSLEERQENYTRLIKSLAPGLTQLIVHLCDPSGEFDTIIGHRPQEKRRYWDAVILQSERFKEALASNGITLINWRDIQKNRYH
ncbi:MAG TPA: polysaccharide deacetylase family protein [Gammaproteobacteria bacterium]|nr:polysaccharide deacetylase family protein [Gammaproteobacteria bacterium]